MSNLCKKKLQLKIFLRRVTSSRPLRNLHQQWPMQCLGGRMVSSTERMKFSWMLLKVSTSWLEPREMFSAQRLSESSRWESTCQECLNFGLGLTTRSFLSPQVITKETYNILLWKCYFSKDEAKVRVLNWRMLSSINVSDCQDLKMTEQYHLFPQMENLNWCPTGINIYVRILLRWYHVQVEHARQATDLDWVGDREARPLQGGDHGQGQVTVQKKINCQQCRDHDSCSKWCRFTQV